MAKMFLFVMAGWAGALALPSLTSAAQPPPAAAPAVLTNALQVLHLTREQAAQGLPVRVGGVVTYADAAWNIWFVQDGTAGIYFHRTNNSPALVAGQQIELEGVSAPGGFAPVVLAHRIVVRGQSPFPEARFFTFDELAGGAHDSQWVEIEAIVRAAYAAEGDLIFELGAIRNFQAFMPGVTNAVLDSFVDARVRLRGVWASVFNSRGQLSGYQLFSPGLDQLRVLSPARAEPFALPTKPMATVLSFQSASEFGHRIKVAGVVTATDAGGVFYAQDDTSGLRMRTRDPVPLHPGDRLEIAGFPEAAGATPKLEEAVVRRLGKAAVPPPLRVGVEQGFKEEWDARLIQLEGELVETTLHSGEAKLVVKASQHLIEARLAGTNAIRELQQFGAGSRLAVTGVGSIQLDNFLRPAALSLVLRSPRDVQILRPPPWWTVPRALALFGFTSLGLLVWRLAGLREEARLKENYRVLVDNANDLICTQTLAGAFTKLNAAWSKLIGHPQPVFQQMRLSDLIVPEQIHSYQEWWGKITAGEPVAPQEFEVLTAAGRRVWLEISSQRIEWPGGEPQIESIARDVTERKAAEAALREKDQLLRRVIDLVPHFIFAKDRHSRFLFANRAAADAVGKSPEQLVGLCDLDLPRDRKQAEAFMQDDREVIASGKPKFVPEEMLTDAAGHVRFHQTVKIPFPAPGTGEPALLGVAVDITERKQAEEALRLSEARFRAIFTTEPECVKIVTPECGLAEMNPSGLAMLGVKTLTEARLKPLIDWIAPEYRKAFRSLHEAVMRGETGSLEFQIVNAQGERLWLDTHAVPLRNEQGEIIAQLGVTRDVTARKQSEHLLRVQNDLLEAITSGQSLPVSLERICRLAEIESPGMLCSILLLDPDGLQLRRGAAPSLPEAYCKAIDGVAIGPAVGSCGTAAYRHAPVIVEDIDTDPLWAGYRHVAAAHGLRACWSTPIIGLDGSALGTFAMYYREPRAPEVKHQQLIEMFTHIAAIALQRARAEKALRESEEKYRLIVDHVAEAVLVLDLELRHVYASPSVFKLYGYPPEEFLKLPLKEILTPESLQVALSIFDEEMKLEAGGAADPTRSRVMESYERRKDGSIICVENTFSFIRDADSKAMRILCIAKDITERKRSERELQESEARFSAVFQASPAAIAVSTWNEGYYVDVNAAFTQLLGYSRAEVLGRTAAQLGVWEYPEQRANIIARLERGERIYGQECVYRAKSGEQRWALAAVDVIELENRRCSIFINHDITERKQAEARQAALEAQLRQAQKLEAIGTLAGGIAHDFNNILGAILGCAELARMEVPANHLAQESLAEIIKASLRARDLVRQILSFSRQQRQDRKLIDIGPVIREALKLLRASLPATIEIQIDIPPQSPTVLADPTQIHQIIINLGSNASHAMRAQGGILKVSLASLAITAEEAAQHGNLPPGRYVCLCVADSGHGMDAAIQERIFEPFFTTKGPGEGTGLGLAVVHGIMRNHEGAITVQSRPGAGATFHLYFPIAEGTVPAGATPPKELRPGNREHILIVDDEPALVQVARRALERLNYQVTNCASAAEALRAFRAVPDNFALLLTDLTMPGLTGLDLAKEIHALRPGLPIILASGYLDTFDRNKAQQQGVGEFLAKPYNLETLGHAVQRLLECGNDGS